MKEVSIIGLDLAKNSFQLHGACADGAVVFRKKLSRGNLLKFIAAQPKCVICLVAMDFADRKNRHRCWSPQ